MDFVLSCLGGKNLTKGGRTMAGADVAKIDHSDVPIRLFKSDFLEFFTHIHPAVVVAIWLPVALYFLAQAIYNVAPGASTAYIPIGFFLGMFGLVVGAWIGAPQWIAPLFSGFIIGYLAYDLIHYATHHFPMRWGFLKFLKRYHMMHHYKTPDARFGVSSPLWDKVFGTMPAESD